MKYKNNRYQVELENGQEVTITIQELKVWANLTYLVRPSMIRVERSEDKKDTFEIYKNDSYLGTVQVIPDNHDQVPYTFVEYHEEKEIDFIEKDYDNLKFNDVRSTEINQKEVGEILDKLDHPDTIRIDIRQVRQVEKINYVGLGLTEWYFKVGVNQDVVKIPQRDTELQKILDTLEEAHDAMKVGMTDKQAFEYYIEPLKEELGIDWNEVEVYRKEAV